MSRDLIESLARGAEHGAELFPDRVDGVVAPARSRVRRARTMRGAALGAVAGAVVVAGAIGVLSLGATDAGPGPAATGPSAGPNTDGAPSTDPITGEDLLADSSPRSVGVDSDSPGRRQAAVVCTPTAAELEQALGTTCGAVWVWSSPILETWASPTQVTVERSGDSATVAIEWAAESRASRPLAVGGAGVTVGLEVEPDTVSGSVSMTVGDDGSAMAGASLWATETTRRVLYSAAPTDATPVDAHGFLQGGSTIVVSAPPAGTATDPLWDLIAADDGGTVTMTLQVPVTSDDGSGTVVYLETSVELELPRATVHAEELLSPTTSRTRDDEPRDDAQAAAVCDVPGGVPEVTDEITFGEPTDCAAVWVEGGALVELTDWSITPGALGGNGTLDWSITNVSGAPLAIDPASLTASLPGAAPVDGPVTADESGLAWEGSLWAPDGTLRMSVSQAGYSLVLQPGMSLSGGGTRVTSELAELIGDDPSAITLQVRVVPRDLTLDSQLVLIASAPAR